MSLADIEKQYTALELLQRLLSNPGLRALPPDMRQRLEELEAARDVAAKALETAWDEAEKLEAAERDAAEEASDYRASIPPRWFL